MAGANTTRTIFFAFGANSAIAVAKGVAAVVTNSGAMMAEAVHSVVDATNQLLLLLGVKQSRKPASEEAPLGYGKSTYFWSFLVAIMLFTLGGMFSIYEGIDKLRHPHELGYPWVAIGVLVFAIIAEGVSMWACVTEVKKVLDGRSYWRWFKETRQSELLVVFGEDIAALTGLVMALTAVLLTLVTGNPLYDALGTISIGVLLIVIAIFIAIEVKALLIGQGMAPRRLKVLREWLGRQEELDSVLNIVTLQLGPDVMVAVKACMVPTTGDQAMIEAINNVEARLRGEFPEVRWLFFEPDNQD